jgi:protein-tyrosine phosphatase
MIDLHTHLLAGVDDGPATIGESLEQAAAMAAAGVAIAACTPHVSHHHGTTPERMEAALATLRAAIATAGIPLEVRGGGEIALERLPHLDAAARARFGLGGNPRLLLLEFPSFGWPLALPSIVAELKAAGTVPVLGHPERSPDVQERPDLLAPLVQAGAFVQLTAGSIDGSTGGAAAARCARALLDRGLAHLLASDTHGPEIRRASLGAVRLTLADDPLAAWLTRAVPAALLAGLPPPPRPPAAPRRRRSWPFG